MPAFLDFGDDDDEDGPELKFGRECEGCKFVNRPRTCRGCEVGELYEERDPEGLDSIFRR